MTDYFDLIKSRRPSQAEVQRTRERLNHQPAIHDSQATADDAVSRSGAAQQRADEAHSRFTNAALDAAHTRAENAHFRATNGSLDSAHTKAENADLNAEGRLSRAGGGIVDGVMRADAFRAPILCLAGVAPAGGTITYAVGSKTKHIPMAQIFDGTEGWIPLPTVGSGTVFVLTNNDTTFTIKNTRTVGETVRGRLWEDPSG